VLVAEPVGDTVPEAVDEDVGREDGVEEDVARGEEELDAVALADAVDDELPVLDAVDVDVTDPELDAVALADAVDDELPVLDAVDVDETDAELDAVALAEAVDDELPVLDAVDVDETDPELDTVAIDVAEGDADFEAIDVALAELELVKDAVHVEDIDGEGVGVEDDVRVALEVAVGVVVGTGTHTHKAGLTTKPGWHGVHGNVYGNQSWAAAYAAYAVEPATNGRTPVELGLETVTFPSDESSLKSYRRACTSDTTHESPKPHHTRVATTLDRVGTRMSADADASLPRAPHTHESVTLLSA
jgi:hypothetical protein